MNNSLKRSLPSPPRGSPQTKRRRQSSVPEATDDPDPISTSTQPSSLAVVALLTLTDPTVVANIVGFIPQPHVTIQGNASHVLATLVNLCQAIGPYDHNLPRHFGPHNQSFWRGMVLQSFDFSSLEETQQPRKLAVWSQLGVCYQPSEYGFLHAIQSTSEPSPSLHAWPENEDAFTLFCDLALLVDKLSGFITTHVSSAGTPPATPLIPCLLRPSAMQATVKPSTTRQSGQHTKRTLHLPLREIRRSRRQLLVQIVTNDLEDWAKFTDKTRQVECYAGRSHRSKRWLGTERIVLLFCHGGSFNRESWAPILQRLTASSLLHRVPCELVTFDWRYHGAKRSDAEPATLYYEDGDTNIPRVEHAGKHWTQWAPLDLLQLTETIKQDDAALQRTTRIVGIGHSMGAATLLKVEISNPGTFDGLVLFEPPCTLAGTEEAPKSVASTMVIYTLAREEEWNSWEAVLDHFKAGKAYRRWHPESLTAFLRGGIVRKSNGNFKLAMPLIQEASLYCHQVMAFTMDQFNRVQCRVVLEYGDHTQLFNLPVVHEIARQLPNKYTLAEPLEGKTHLTVVEDPDTCARHIITNLETFPIFQHALNRSSKASKL